MTALQVLRELRKEKWPELKTGEYNLPLILEAMHKFAELSQCNFSDNWSIGKRVEVTGCFHGHEFNIGELVDIIEHEPRDMASWLCTNGKNNWWLSESEGRLI